MSVKNQRDSGRYLWTRQLRAGAPAAIVLFALVWGLQQLSWFEAISLRALDLSTKLYASDAVSPDVVVIGADDRDVELMGTPRSKANLLKVLKALDGMPKRAIYFTETVNNAADSQQAEFVAAVLARPDVYLMNVYADAEMPTKPQEYVLADAAGRILYSGSDRDSDYAVRRCAITQIDADKIRKSMAVHAAQTALEHNQRMLRWDPLSASTQLEIAGKPVKLRPAQLHSVNLVLPAQWKTLLIAPRYWGGVQRFNFAQLLAGEIPAEALRNRIVFVGPLSAKLTVLLPMAAGASATRSVAYAPPERVALLTQNLISAARLETPVLRELSRVADGLWLITWIVLTLFWLASASALAPWLVRIAALGAGATIICVSAIAWGWWLPWIPTLAAIALSVLEFFRRALARERALRKMVAISQSVLDCLPEPLFLSDENGRLRLVNRAMCKLLAGSQRDLLNRPVRQFFPLLAKADSALSPHRDQLGRSFQCVIKVHELEQNLARDRLSIGLLTQVSVERGFESRTIFASRCNSFRAIAREQSVRALVGIVELTDRQDLENELAPAICTNYYDQVAGRLQSGIIHAQALCRPMPGCYWILIVLDVDATTNESLPAVIQGCLSWPIQIAEDSVAVLHRLQVFDLARDDDWRKWSHVSELA